MIQWSLDIRREKCIFRGVAIKEVLCITKTCSSSPSDSRLTQRAKPGTQFTIVTSALAHANAKVTARRCALRRKAGDTVTSTFLVTEGSRSGIKPHLKEPVRVAHLGGGDGTVMAAIEQFLVSRS